LHVLVLLLLCRQLSSKLSLEGHLELSKLGGRHGLQVG
jgi:hypothetical protein